ncbi:type II toxin-antitoxin system RelE/ParE family toxin [Rhizobium rhizophilum]|uniref:Type II toxin-antitoxin system RelE/ParE family toxin n=1 Tax=Rhizobium rhizophilum TaxID=1850373 RepID=A0ABY2QUR8_9HYPH|nr:type II toxin-antitoxin system RelE/ParE family toxin [Rhizobium rhizophilum]THV14280.1 type II toxin-antitoxin system RelE/ParE family toxin [Rhizobium rhizophilum]
MPRLIVTKRAAAGIGRCRSFLGQHSSEAAARAGQSIVLTLFKLETSPLIGRPVEGHNPLRELVIPFGKSGYVALYRYDAEAETVYVLAFRHQREAGY